MESMPQFIGIDIAAEQFHATLGHAAPWQIVVRATAFENSAAGFEHFHVWLQEHGCTPAATVLCMEATGVYGEGLAYFLVAQQYRLAVEPPLKVKRAFKVGGPKTDALDSAQIAEYAYRYHDQLTFWQPRAELLEQLQVLLTTREQLVKQRTAHKNSRRALLRKAVRTALAETVHERLIQELTTQIQAVEREIKRLIDREPPFAALLAFLLTIPGVGLLLATHLLVLTQGGTQFTDAKHLTAHLGICPQPHQSGTSVHKPATSRHYGPPLLRKLLHLGARSACTHKAPYRDYYQRKLREGKPKRLVINNVANKIVKASCAVLHARVPFDANYPGSKNVPA
jgi:transposase